LQAWKDLYKEKNTFTYDITKIQEKVKSKGQQILTSEENSLLNTLDKANSNLTTIKNNAKNTKDPNQGYGRLSQSYLDTFKENVINPYEEDLNNKKK